MSQDLAVRYRMGSVSLVRALRGPSKRSDAATGRAYKFRRASWSRIWPRRYHLVRFADLSTLLFHLPAQSTPGGSLSTDTMPHALIVEDDADAARALALLIQAEGFDTATTHSLAEARRQALFREPDVVLPVGADPILTHPADPILTRGWTLAA